MGVMRALHALHPAKVQGQDKQDLARMAIEIRSAQQLWNVHYSQKG